MSLVAEGDKDAFLLRVDKVRARIRGPRGGLDQDYLPFPRRESGPGLR